MINFRPINKNIFLNVVFVLSIFLIDRISKVYIIDLAKENINMNIYSSEILNIILIWNEGIAFGLFSNSSEVFYNGLTIIICLISLLVLLFAFKQDGLKKYALLSIFAGSLGNLYDRIFFSAVPDFIDFHINEFHWFIFNAADVFISIGVIIMIMTEFFAKERNQNE